MSDTLPTDTTFEAGGRRFDLELTYGRWKRLKKDRGIDLADVAGGEVFRRLSADRELLVGVLYDLASYDDGQELTQEAFEDSLDGPSIDAAGEALLAAIVGFSPAEARAALRAVIDLEKEASQTRTERLIESIQKGPIREKVTAAIDAEIAAIEKGTPKTKALSKGPRKKAKRPAKRPSAFGS